MKIEDVFYINEKDWYKLQAWATLAHKEDENERKMAQSAENFSIFILQITKNE